MQYGKPTIIMTKCPEHEEHTTKVELGINQIWNFEICENTKVTKRDVGQVGGIKRPDGKEGRWQPLHEITWDDTKVSAVPADRWNKASTDQQVMYSLGFRDDELKDIAPIRFARFPSETPTYGDDAPANGNGGEKPARTKADKPKAEGGVRSNKWAERPLSWAVTNVPNFGPDSLKTLSDDQKAALDKAIQAGALVDRVIERYNTELDAWKAAIKPKAETKETLKKVATEAEVKAATMSEVMMRHVGGLCYQIDCEADWDHSARKCAAGHELADMPAYTTKLSQDRLGAQVGAA